MDKATWEEYNKYVMNCEKALNKVYTKEKNLWNKILTLFNNTVSMEGAFDNSLYSISYLADSLYKNILALQYNLDTLKEELKKEEKIFQPS